MGSIEFKLDQESDEQDDTLREYKAPGFWEDPDNWPWERRMVVGVMIMGGTVMIITLIVALLVGR
jgi:hypothetical protein